jgi:hypothetical protein
MREADSPCLLRISSLIHIQLSLSMAEYDPGSGNRQEIR